MKTRSCQLPSQPHWFAGWRRIVISLGGGALVCAPQFAPAAGALADFSLEELVNVKITSVSKHEENLHDAAAAVFVLNNDDLRRSGFTTLADALRLVPGVQVAAIGSSDWAVSARGFNTQFANKLLVMIDGRAVYSPAFSGVYWDVQQVFLDDVDRIEVIRGPGATIWGANAVNGVISVMSKSARDTQGGLIYGGGGNVNQVLGGGRYGSQLNDDTFFRVSANYQLHDDFKTGSGQSAQDNWDLVKGGFRMDHYAASEAQLTWQGDIYTGNLADRARDLHGLNTLGRWTQPLSDRSSYEVQAYLDHTYRNDNLGEFDLDTADLNWQHRFGLGERNDVIWGLGYRFTSTRLHQANNPAIAIVDDNLTANLFSAFAQNEFQILPDELTFTLGSKIEHNDFTGFEVQPSARLMYKPTAKQTIWAAVSRAVRTPSQLEGEEFITFAMGAPGDDPMPTLVGNPGVKSEQLWAYELGYRLQVTPRVNVDLATFYNDYTGLIDWEPTDLIPGSPNVLTFESENNLHAAAYGGEALVSVAATDAWRWSASYSFLLIDARGTFSGITESPEWNAPTHQVVVRSSYDFSARASLDGQLRYVDNVQNIAGYLTADLRFAYRPTPNLEFSLVGQNLLDARHPEQASTIGAPTYEVPRSYYGKVTWRF